MPPLPFRNALERVATLTLKEFYSVLLDRKSRAQMFVAPFLMLAVFSFAITMEVKSASLGILNLDAGDLGKQFSSYFSSGPTFTYISELRGTQEIRPAIENQKALMVLVIPEDFSRKLASRNPVSLQIVLDGRKINAAQIANGYANAIIRQFELELAKRWDIAPSGPQIAVAARQLFNPNLNYLWFTLPILLVLLTQLIALIVSGMSVARERELGTFEQLLVSPLSSAEIVVSKVLPAASIAFCEGIAIHCVALFIFGVPFTGSLSLLAASFGVFILAVTGVGLFISSLCSTQQQAFLGCFAYMVPAVLLSGFAAPIENMPDFLQYFTLLNPARHIIAISLGIYLKGMPLQDILPELAWLAGIATTTLAWAGWLFKKKTQ